MNLDGESAYVRKMAAECATAIRSSGGEGTIAATIYDVMAYARREMANTAGALLRDRAAELNRQAEENARESDSPADQGEAGLLKDIASEVENLSAAVYALGDPPKPEPANEVDDDIAF